MSIKNLHTEAYPFNGWGWEWHEDDTVEHYTTNAIGDGLWRITRDAAGHLCEYSQVEGTAQFSLPLPRKENKRKTYARIKKQMAD